MSECQVLTLSSGRVEKFTTHTRVDGVCILYFSQETWTFFIQSCYVNLICRGVWKLYL